MSAVMARRRIRLAQSLNSVALQGFIIGTLKAMGMDDEALQKACAIANVPCESGGPAIVVGHMESAWATLEKACAEGNHNALEARAQCLRAADELMALLFTSDDIVDALISESQRAVHNV